MTTRGILGKITEGPGKERPVLVIGRLIPRIRHSDGVDTYLVVEHPSGIPVPCADGKDHNLLAYPSSWLGPRDHNPDAWILATHERLPFSALIPCFDRSSK